MRRVITTLVGGLVATAVAASVGMAVASTSTSPTPNGVLPGCCVR